MGDNQQCRPSFFTIIMDGYNTQHMMVPHKFVKYLDKEFCSNDAFLMCPNGDKWQVTILKKGDNIYMSHGWSLFLKDNSVMQGEFLVFTYDVKNCFQVQIFGKNGTDHRSMVRTRNAAQIKTCASSSHIHESKPSQEELASLLPKDKPSVPKGSTGIEKRSNDCNLVESFTSNNPYFKHLIKKTNVNKGCFLNIAAEFAKKHLLPTVEEITLRNSSGKCWEVTVACYYNKNRRYHRFSKGISRFVSDNKLKIGDTCIFELEDGKNMKVHIFRCAPN